MFNYINKDFDAKVASVRNDVKVVRGAKRVGFDVAIMRAVDTLRHLVRMLRHSSIRHFCGSAQPSPNWAMSQWTGPGESRDESPLEYSIGQIAGRTQGPKMTLAMCRYQTTNNRLKPAQNPVPSLVTT